MVSRLDQPIDFTIAGVPRRYARALRALLVGMFDEDPGRRVEALVELQNSVAAEDSLRLLGLVLMACRPDDALFEMLDEFVASANAGAPQPSFAESLAAEAREWATFASEPERKRYMLACFRSLPVAERLKFLLAGLRSLPAAERAKFLAPAQRAVLA